MAEDQEKHKDAGKPDPFKHKEFEVLARLFRSKLPASVEDVDTLVSRLGRSAELLPETLQKELEVREKDKAVLNFFRTDKAKAGLNALTTLVRGLDREVKARVGELAGETKTKTQSRCWRIGLELLADRIAAVAGKEEQ